MNNTQTPFPASDSLLMLEGPEGPLEVQVEWPDADQTAIAATAIVCHPLPTGGGTKDNKVVTTAAKAFRALGMPSVRFNFRGTGKSAGAFDNGIGEVADLMAVVEWVRATRPNTTLWLAGFSFGSYVSLSSIGLSRPDYLVSIAPPAGLWDFDALVRPGMPWLVVQGEADELVDANVTKQWFDQLQAPQARYVSMPETSHFFHGKLIDLREAILAWAADVRRA